MGNIPDLSSMCTTMSCAHVVGFPFYGIHIFSAMLHTLPAPLGNMLRTSARVSVWICLCLCNHDLTVQGMGEL